MEKTSSRGGREQAAPPPATARRRPTALPRHHGGGNAQHTHVPPRTPSPLPADTDTQTHTAQTSHPPGAGGPGRTCRGRRTWVQSCSRARPHFHGQVARVTSGHGEAEGLPPTPLLPHVALLPNSTLTQTRRAPPQPPGERSTLWCLRFPTTCRALGWMRLPGRGTGRPKTQIEESVTHNQDQGLPQSGGSCHSGRRGPDGSRWETPTSPNPPPAAPRSLGAVSGTPERGQSPRCHAGEPPTGRHAAAGTPRSRGQHFLSPSSLHRRPKVLQGH